MENYLLSTNSFAILLPLPLSPLALLFFSLSLSLSPLIPLRFLSNTSFEGQSGLISRDTHSQNVISEAHHYIWSLQLDPLGQPTWTRLGRWRRGENSDGPAGLAKPSGIRGRRRLAAIHAAAHAGGDAGGAPVCVHPRGGRGRDVSRGPAVPRPAHQRIFAFERVFQEPLKTQRICPHGPEEVLLRLLHRPAGEAGGGHGLHV